MNHELEGTQVKNNDTHSEAGEAISAPGFPHFVVGIGASAGGLEALETFFDHMSPNTGMTFIIVQHLSPNYKSFMAELLSKHTRMNVTSVEQDMRIEPNQVYLIPPRKHMTITDGVLQTTDQQPGLNLPIDVFFRSLAADQGRKAIGVVLSGTGSDGSRGIAAIKEAGGLVLVQDEHSAKFDGMPNSARQTGNVDLIMAPADMADELIRYTKQTEDDDSFGNLAKYSQTEQQIKQIFELVKQTSGIDFNYYKRNSIYRRIERRMASNNLQSLPEYLTYLQNHPHELEYLRNDFLIRVTEFFRDPEAFDLLAKKVFPKIFEQRAKDQDVRVWVAACSTGEEAYTLAMMLKQYMEEHLISEDLGVKIFATDLDKASVDFASQGIYPISAVKNVPIKLLKRYFVKNDDTYQVCKELRKMVLFAPHNIIKDPPFSNLDLITCRNMLIYLQPEIQKKVLSLFHFVLNPEGFLFLGPSETIGKLTTQFEPLDRRWNIFEHISKDRERYFHDPLQDMSVRSSEKSKPVTSAPPLAVDREPRYKKNDELYLTFIDEHLDPSMIIDTNNDIVHISGEIAPYLQMTRGKPSWNIYKMLDSKLCIALTTAMQKVRKDGNEVTYKDFYLKNGHFETTVDLIVKPFSRKNRLHEKLTLVMFKHAVREEGVVHEYDSFQISDNVNQRIIELERELQRAEEKLQMTTEELETSNEELQATNEELVAANEELQSTNEELQSVNEELVTVNTEYQYKIEELTELNNDINNFLISTKIGTIFLDKKLCIRRFTPAVTNEINLMDIDYGRPLGHISHNFKCDLVKEARKVIKTAKPVEREIQSNLGKWYKMRVLPYRTTDHTVNGVVFTFVDITELKNANEELLKLSYAIQQSPSIVAITNLDGRVEYVNPCFTEVTGFHAKDVLGKNIRHLHGDMSDHQFQDIWEKVKVGNTWIGEVESSRNDGEQYWESVKMLPIKNNKGKVIQVLRVSEDITDLKATQELLRKSEMLSGIGQLAAGIAHEIRNPLTALKGFTQLLLSGAKANENYIAIMSDELNRIEQIVSELLVLAKPQAVDYLRKDIVPIVKDVLMLLETQAIMNQVDIVFESTAQQAFVNCVDNQLKQVFINVLKNAIEAMPKGGSISVAIEEKETHYAISIADTGTGIPEELVSRLGEPFYSTKEKGTGLGLMVSYRIIEHHQGKIHVQSERGKGTTVTIKLPKNQ